MLRLWYHLHFATDFPFTQGKQGHMELICGVALGFPRESPLMI